MNLEWVILGHSERRTHFKETNEDIAHKMDNAFKNGLKVIYCFGETLEHREANQTKDVVKQQLDSIKEVCAGNWSKVVLAYEPVWAIGTGKTATTEQVDEIHTWIREYLKENAENADSIRIIYGGSVNDKNCNELINIKDVDGFLVGGAALKEAFIEIVKSGNGKKN